MWERKLGAKPKLLRYSKPLKLSFLSLYKMAASVFYERWYTIIDMGKSGARKPINQVNPKTEKPIFSFLDWC